MRDQTYKGVVTPAFLPGAAQALTGSGDVSVKVHKTNVTTGAGAAALTLANGEIEKQVKVVQLIVDGGGDATLTPTSLRGGSTITFADAGDTAELIYYDGAWEVLDLYNRADGATAPVLA